MNKAAYLLSILLAVLLASGCNGNGNNGNGDGDAGNGDADAGPVCLTDRDCTPPETCQPDNTCAYVPDPNNNKATGEFYQQMDAFWSQGYKDECALCSARVGGKFDGRYLYLDHAGDLEYNQSEDRTEMQIFGLVTSRILYSLVMYLPRDCPTGQMINFGVGGVAIGTLDEVTLNEDGYEIGRRSVGEIIDGHIKFSDYDYNTGAEVIGSLEISFRVVK
jgi:hypothetical protein